jgi:Mlc titration factor MtfA (ptsG expression regulator)
MEATKEKHETHTPGPWQISCIDGVEDSLMVGGGDDGSNIVADIRTYENDILNAQAELYDDIPAMRSRAHVEGWSQDSVADIDKKDASTEKRLAELEIQEKEAHANARLIAAAPEMYEVLSELLDTLEMSKGYGFDEEYDKLREVLAKVEEGEG